MTAKTSEFFDPDYLITPHFAIREMWCPCCHQLYLNPMHRLCMMLELVRSDVGPLEVASGHRCRLHNIEVGGREFSRHMESKAADIKVMHDGFRFRIIQSAMAHGFRRIGVGKTIVHLDNDESVVPILWHYYP
jgi:hypothetical protein